MEIWGTVAPVSYTHLDVYKRQEHPGGLRPLRAAAGLCGAAVGPSPAQRGHAAQMRRGGAIPLKILLLTDIHGNLPALEAVLNTPQARSADLSLIHI